jgi:hypothetical protein
MALAGREQLVMRKPWFELIEDTLQRTQFVQQTGGPASEHPYCWTEFLTSDTEEVADDCL